MCSDGGTVVKTNNLTVSILIPFLGIILLVVTDWLDWSIEWPLRVVTMGIVGWLLYLLVQWHVSSFDYKCSECDHCFSISFLTDLTSPHYPDKKYLRCPACNKRNWCREIPKTQVTVESDADSIKS